MCLVVGIHESWVAFIYIDMFWHILLIPYKLCSSNCIFFEANRTVFACNMQAIMQLALLVTDTQGTRVLVSSQYLNFRNNFL